MNLDGLQANVRKLDLNAKAYNLCSRGVGLGLPYWRRLKICPCGLLVMECGLHRGASGQ